MIKSCDAQVACLSSQAICMPCLLSINQCWAVLLGTAASFFMVLIAWTILKAFRAQLDAKYMNNSQEDSLYHNICAAHVILFVAGPIWCSSVQHAACLAYLRILGPLKINAYCCSVILLEEGGQTFSVQSISDIARPCTWAVFDISVTFIGSLNEYDYWR